MPVRWRVKRSGRIQVVVGDKPGSTVSYFSWRLRGFFIASFHPSAVAADIWLVLPLANRDINSCHGRDDLELRTLSEYSRLHEHPQLKIQRIIQAQKADRKGSE